MGVFWLVSENKYYEDMVSRNKNDGAKGKKSLENDSYKKVQKLKGFEENQM